MIFCGQCGLQVSMGSTRCPRCGAAIEESAASTATAAAVSDDLRPDDPTIASPALSLQPQAKPNTPQQPLILRPGGNNSSYDYGTNQQDAFDATRMVENPGYNTQMPTNQAMGSSYAGFTPPGAGSYPSYGGGTTGFQQGSPYNNAPSTQMGVSYAQFPGSADQFQQEGANKNAKGRTTGLVLVLLGLLLILSAVVLFAVQQGIFGGHA